MCGQRVDAKPDICVMDENYVLLVQQDQGELSADDPEPQLIAGAISAFYDNNRRRRAAGIQPIDHQAFAEITMTGTTPVFYEISTTSSLEAIATAQYPLKQTVVKKLIPVPNPSQYLQDGMLPLENRLIVLQCFEAFKQIVGQ